VPKMWLIPASAISPKRTKRDIAIVVLSRVLGTGRADWFAEGYVEGPTT
jgi:hypothetical protein